MTGLLYKELRQNRAYLWMIALIGPAMLLATICLTCLPETAGQTRAEVWTEMIGRGESPFSVIHVLSAIMPFCFCGLLVLTVFTQDESKKWGYFTASHPKGVKGAIYTKYVLVFLVTVIAYISASLTEEIIMLADYFITGAKAEQMQSYSMFYLFLVFMQIFLRMIDIPFIVRFGHKRGEQVKVAVIGGIMVAGFIYLLFGPLPGGESGDPFVSLYDWWAEFSTGKAKNWVYILLAAFLWITIIGYYLSYRLSCKLYLKGVEQYDK